MLSVIVRIFFVSHTFTIFQYDILPSYNFESNSVKDLLAQVNNSLSIFMAQ